MANIVKKFKYISYIQDKTYEIILKDDECLGRRPSKLLHVAAERAIDIEVAANKKLEGLPDVVVIPREQYWYQVFDFDGIVWIGAIGAEGDIGKLERIDD